MRRLGGKRGGVNLQHVIADALSPGVRDIKVRFARWAMIHV